MFTPSRYMSNSAPSQLPRAGVFLFFGVACLAAFFTLLGAFRSVNPCPTPPLQSVHSSQEKPTDEPSPLAEEWKRDEIRKIAARRRSEQTASQIAAVALIGLVLFLIYFACTR